MEPVGRGRGLLWGTCLPALPQAPTSCLPSSQNVLEITLYDKDILGSNQLCLLLFDLGSLKPGQPHRHTFPLNHQVSQHLGQQ